MIPQKQVLIDQESLTNVLFRSSFKGIRLDLDEIREFHISLVGLPSKQV